MLTLNIVKSAAYYAKSYKTEPLASDHRLSPLRNISGCLEAESLNC